MAEKILALAGSLRVASFNRKLVRIAADGARAAGAVVTEIDLREIPLPLYDGDMEREQGLPPNAKLFKRILLEHQGMLISSPEYNTAMTAVLIRKCRRFIAAPVKSCRSEPPGRRAAGPGRRDSAGGQILPQVKASRSIAVDCRQRVPNSCESS